MMPPEEAWRQLRSHLPPVDSSPEQQVSAEASVGRISARPVFARHNSPSYHGSAMDGFAVRSASTTEASEANPVRLRIGQDALTIDTGDALVPGMDAVIMVEHTHEPEEGVIEIVSSARPWQHVRLTGEDMVQGELVLPRGKRVTAWDIAALLAAGQTQVWVRRKPRVGIIPTGDELRQPGQAPVAGGVIEFNSRMIAALVEEWGGEAEHFTPAPDDPHKIEATVCEALARCDIVVVNAGSSAGRDDHTPAVIGKLGKLLVHGINIMPGKPTAIGIVDGKPVLGLPGYPVSTAVAAELVLRRLISLRLGIAPPERDRLRATLGRKIPSKIGHEEVLRVQVGRVGERYVATALRRGAGVITSLSRASGLVRLPPEAEGLEAGSEVDVELLVSRQAVDGAIVHVGSHDLSLDLLNDLLHGRASGRSLISVSVGSLGGLLALSRGECLIAGTHLVDPETGEYNLSYVRRYLEGESIVLVHLVRREQGLYVQSGNPLGIRGVGDLAGKDVRFVNRQRGAGTRVLLDAKLADAKIDPRAIRGYGREEHTHMAAAVAVASDVGNVSLGIRAAAKALQLSFVTLEWEPYELTVREADLERIAPLLEVMRSAEFRKSVEALGGYDAGRSGEVRRVKE